MENERRIFERLRQKVSKAVSFAGNRPIFGKIRLYGIAAGSFYLLKRIGCSAGECCMTMATICMAWIAYKGNKQSEENTKIAKASADAAQKQAEAASEQTKAIQQQIEISKQQAEAAKQQATIAIQSLEEAQKQREETYRPRLLVYFEKKHDFKLQPVVKNVGNMPARSIDIQTTTSWLKHKMETTGLPKIKEYPNKCWRDCTLSEILCSLNRSVPYLQCDREICFGNILPLSPVQLFLMHAEEFCINAQYGYPYKENKKRFNETFPLYLSNIVFNETEETVVPSFERADNEKPDDIYAYIKDFLALCLPPMATNLAKDYATAISCNFVQDLDFVSSVLENNSEAEPEKTGSAENYLKPIHDAYGKVRTSVMETVDKICSDAFEYRINNLLSTRFQVATIVYQVEVIRNLFKETNEICYSPRSSRPVRSINEGKKKYDERLLMGLRCFVGGCPEILKEVLEKIDEIQNNSSIETWRKSVRMFETIFRKPFSQKFFQDPIAKSLNFIPKSIAETLREFRSEYQKYLEQIAARCPKVPKLLPDPSGIRLANLIRSLSSDPTQSLRSCMNELKYWICADIVLRQLEMLWQKPLWTYESLLLGRYSETVHTLLCHASSGSVHENKKTYLKKALNELAILISEKMKDVSVMNPLSYCNFSPSKRHSPLFASAYQLLNTFFTEHTELDHEHLEQFLTEP